MLYVILKSETWSDSSMCQMLESNETLLSLLESSGGMPNI